MRNLLLLIALFVTINTFGQTYEIEAFSKDYTATVTVDKSKDEYPKTGTIKVVNIKTKQTVITVKSESLQYADVVNGKVKANVQEMPYGEQSILIFQDFNFDGQKDLAIQDGQNSCYGGPSYQIFLKTDKDFTKSESFTRLAQEYCGMFTVDAVKKKIYAMTKSGCCWHEYSDFVVENNAPKAVKVIVEEMVTFPFFKITTQIWDGKKMQETISETVNLKEEALVQLLSFTVTENGKKVILFQIDETLYYTLLKKDGTIEFRFPTMLNEATPFKLSKTKDSLVFKNASATYTIYQKSEGGKITSIGITVKTNGKLYDLKGNLKTVNGNLNRIKPENLENVDTM
jgi:hypothetical protein